MTISAALAAYSMDRLPLIQRCVDSLLTGDLVPHEIVVSVDTNPELANRLQALYPDIVVVNSEGRGASEARNTALRVATAPYVAFIDDDAKAHPSWLQTYADFFSERPEAKFVGGYIEPDYEGGADVVPPALLWTVGCTYLGHPEGVVPMTRPIGANMAMDREAVLGVGGFDPKFGPVNGTKAGINEELSLATRVRDAHGADSVWYVPAAAVDHFVPRARTTFKFQVGRGWAEGRSKASIHGTFGGTSLGHDKSYLLNTMLPEITRYARTGELVNCARHAAVLGATATSYAAHRVGSVLKIGDAA